MKGDYVFLLSLLVFGLFLTGVNTQPCDNLTEPILTICSLSEAECSGGFTNATCRQHYYALQCCNGATNCVGTEDSVAKTLGVLNCNQLDRCFLSVPLCSDPVVAPNCAVPDAFSCNPRPNMCNATLDIETCRSYSGCKYRGCEGPSGCEEIIDSSSCLGVNGCSWVGQCEHDCDVPTQTECTELDSTCEGFSEPTCVVKSCRQDIPCNQQSGCIFLQELGICKKERKYYGELSLFCPYNMDSFACRNWDICDLALPECHDLRKYYCCGDGQNDPGCSNENYDCKTCGVANSACSLNPEECRLASSFACTEIPGNPCSQKNLASCEDDPLCVVQPLCTAIDPNNANSCYVDNCNFELCVRADVCKPRCDSLNSATCSSNPHCAYKKLGDTCIYNACESTNSTCNSLNGCILKRRTCLTEARFFNYTTTCPFAKDSMVCVGWHFCEADPNSSECLNLKKKHCCSDNQLEDPFCFSIVQSLDCDSECPFVPNDCSPFVEGAYVLRSLPNKRADRTPPPISESVQLAFYNGRGIYSGSNSEYVIFETSCENRTKYINMFWNTLEPFRYTFTQANFYPETSVLIIGQFAECEFMNSEVELMIYEESLEKCYARNNVCTFIPGCSIGESNYCKYEQDAYPETICSNLQPDACSINPDCQASGVCEGSGVCITQFDEESCTSNNCTWSPLCIANCEQFKSESECTSKIYCSFNSTLVCQTTDCSPYTVEEDCSSFSGCRFGSMTKSCYPSLDRAETRACPLMDSRFCSEYIYCDSTSIEFYNKPICETKFMGPYCCKTGYFMKDPVCDGYTFDCEPIIGCDPISTDTCADLAGVYDYLGVTSSRIHFYMISADLPRTLTITSYDSFTLLFNDNSFRYSGKVKCDPIDGYWNIDLRLNASLVVRGEIYPLNYVEGEAKNLTFTMGLPNSCDRTTLGIGEFEFYMKNSFESRCQVATLSDCLFLSPYCEALTSTPSCSLPKSSLIAGGDISNFTSQCFASKTQATCLSLGCQWNNFTCLANDCSAFSSTECETIPGCELYDGYLCSKADSRLQMPCPFEKKSSTCYSWRQCVPNEPYYDKFACDSLVERTCCKLGFADRPSICLFNPNITCSKFCEVNPIGSCPTCPQWQNCPHEVFGSWSSSNVIYSNPNSVSSTTLEWTLSLNSNTRGFITKRTSGAAGSTATIQYPIDLITCKGNFSQIFQISMYLGGSQKGYILKGTVAPSGLVSFTEGSVVLDSDRTSMVLSTRDWCSYPQIPNFFPQDSDIALAKLKFVSPTANLTCDNPITATLPTQYTGTTSRDFILTPNILLDNCVRNTGITMDYTWTISSSINLAFPNRLSLQIPRRTLSVGIYNVTLLIRPTGYPSITLNTVIRVISQRPIVVLRPSNTQRTVPVSQPLVLDASQSFDPDTIPVVPGVGIQCLWSCSYSDNSPCPSFDTNLCLTTVSANSLEPNKSAIFTITVSNNNGASSSQITILGLSQLAAELELSVEGVSPSGYINPSLPLRIFGKVKNSFNQNFTKIDLLWSVVITPQTQWFNLSDPANVQSPKNSFNLVVRPNVLEPDSAYICRLTATIDGVSNFADIQVYSYPAPSGGSFTVDPTEGIYLNTSVTFQALSWRDQGSPDSSLRYNFAYEEQGKPRVFLRSRPTDSNTFTTFNLPFGTLSAYAYIYSDYSLTIEGPITINIANVSLPDTQELNNQLQGSLKVGDQDTILQLVRLILQSISSLNSTEQEVKQLKDSLLQAIQVASTLSSLSTDEVNQLIPLLRDIISLTSTLDSETKSLVFDLLEEFVELAFGVGEEFIIIVSTIKESLDNQNSTEAKLFSEKINKALEDILLSILSQKACNENPDSFTTSQFKLYAELRDSFAGFSTIQSDFGYQFGTTNFLNSNDLNDLGDDSCSQFHSKVSDNPYNWKEASQGEFDSLCNVVTLDFYTNNGTTINVSGLTEEQSFKIIFTCSNSTGKSLEELECIYWDEEEEIWSNKGCTKLTNESTETRLVCLCNHLTSFSIGSIVIATNVIDPINDANLLNKLFTTRGGRISVATVCVLFALYMIALPLAIFFEIRDRAGEAKPDPTQLNEFINRFAALYHRKVDMGVLETRRLDKWIDVYEVFRNTDPNFQPTFWDRLRIHMKHGFRYNHLYISVFFTPLMGYTRPERVTVAWTILYMNLVVNAFLYQFDENNTGLRTYAAKMFSAFLSSLIVFPPTTLVGYLFRRLKRRNDPHVYLEDHPEISYEKMGITNPENLDKRSKFAQILFEWHMPWWVGVFLYIITFFGWVFAIYCTLIYGVKFDDVKAVAFFESFATSVAVSICILQTLKAMVGGLFITITSGVISIAAITALLVGGNMVAMT